MPDFSFSRDVDVPSIPRQELIITGDVVLSHKIDGYDTDNWECVRLRLFLSESMHYHLWIRLDYTPHVANHEDSFDVNYHTHYHTGINDDGLVRNIVIKDLCRMNFLKEVVR